IENGRARAVGERRIEEPKSELAAEHCRLRPAAGLLQDREERIDGLVPAAGERAADPVKHAATGLALRRRRQIGKPRRRKMRAQRLRESYGSGIEVLVHGESEMTSGSRQATETETSV